MEQSRHDLAMKVADGSATQEEIDTLERMNAALFDQTAATLYRPSKPYFDPIIEKLFDVSINCADTLESVYKDKNEPIPDNIQATIDTIRSNKKEYDKRTNRSTETGQDSAG